MRRLVFLFVAACLVVFAVWWDNTYRVLPKKSMFRLLYGSSVVKKKDLHDFLHRVIKFSVVTNTVSYHVVHEGSKWFWVTSDGKKVELKQRFIDRFLSAILSAKILRILDKNKPDYRLEHAKDKIVIYIKGISSPWVIELGAKLPVEQLRYVKVKDKILVLSSAVFYGMNRLWWWKKEVTNGRRKNKGNFSNREGGTVKAHSSSNGGR